MPRPKPEGDPSQFRNHLGVMLDDSTLAMVKRVATRYGISRSAAARLLIRAGAAHHDPSPPKEEETP